MYRDTVVKVGLRRAHFDGHAEALDFACSSGLRNDMWSRAQQNPNVVFDEYEEYKFRYKTEKVI